MPESWLNTAMKTARKIGNRYFRRNSRPSPRACSASMDVNNLLEFQLVVLPARSPEYFPSFHNARLLHQPARTSRDRKQHSQEKSCRNGRHAQLPTPFALAKLHESHCVIREIGQQYAEHDIELEYAHQPAAPFRRRNFGNVNWPERSEEHTSELQSQSNLVCRL